MKILFTLEIISREELEISFNENVPFDRPVL